MENKEQFCYLICDIKTDLPLVVVDTYQEIMDFLDIKRTTTWKMIKKGAIVHGCYVEKVLL